MATIDTIRLNVHRLAAIAVVSLVATASLAHAEEPASAVRKVDPRTRTFAPVAPDEIIPGKIYSHYSPRHNRYVWAFATEGGNFSYALGPGSIESPRNFDVVTSAEETEKILEAEIGAWAEVLRESQSELMVRLGADNRWEVLRQGSIRSHFDLDSGRRWEWHGGRKVSVLSTGGVTWRYTNDKYQPAHPWLSTACAAWTEQLRLLQ